MSVINQSLITNVIKSFEGEAKVIIKARATQDKTIQTVLDAMIIACDQPKPIFMKGNAKSNPARGQIKAMFDSIVEAGYISKASGATYQTCFWLAFESGVPFARDLANKKTEAKQAGGIEGTSDAKPTTTAKSKVITLEEAQRSFSVALAQLRAVYQAELASELLDVMLDRFPEFKESTVK